MITFEECQEAGYRPRTIANTSADLTLAIAKNFQTAGEKLTANSATTQRKTYIQLDIANHLSLVSVPRIHLNRILSLKPQSINIAGNGIYTLKNYGIDQNYIDEAVYVLLNQVITELKAWCDHTPSLIRSGGQTGVDEAGLKAAVKLGIPAYCLAPKNWAFRNREGQDVYSEYYFKQRFV